MLYRSVRRVDDAVGFCQKYELVVFELFYKSLRACRVKRRGCGYRVHIEALVIVDYREPELREKRLSAAWQKFAATLKMRRPDIEQRVDGMRDTATELVSSFAGKFLGRTPPAITEKDVDLRNNLHQALKWLSE